MRTALIGFQSFDIVAMDNDIQNVHGKAPTSQNLSAKI
jgi:hypothetical protein